MHGDESEDFISAQECKRCKKSELWEDGYIKQVYRSCALTHDMWGPDNVCTDERVYSRGKRQVQINCICDTNLCNHGNVLHFSTSRILSFSCIGFMVWYVCNIFNSCEFLHWTYL